jgi:hypothetical protein
MAFVPTSARGMCVAPLELGQRTMESTMESESLQPQLDVAQHSLEKALAEACGVDLRQIDTGELIRIEETLATASKAAKDAVSVRLKLRSRRMREQRAPADDARRASQRIFDDIRGKRWHVYAVHPSIATAERVALPEGFRDGWLTFESADEMRRVAPIPEGWEELPIDDLRQLCYKAPATPKRARADAAHSFRPPKR